MDKEGKEKEENAEIVEAGQVYLLMKDDVRISRNSRASWYFNHLNKTISCKTTKQDTSSSEVTIAEGGEKDDRDTAGEKPKTKPKREEFDILTVIPRKAQAQNASRNRVKYKICTDTSVLFLARKYSMAFVLDVSPSAAAPDLQCKNILLERILQSLKNTIKGVTKPIHLQDMHEAIYPQIYITVIASTPLTCCPANQVLIQGYLAKAENMDMLMDILRQRYSEYETAVASSMAEVLHGQFDEERASYSKMTGGIFDDIIERPEYPDRMDYMMTADMAFVNMIRYGMLALQLLPNNSASGIVVITDGVVGVPEASLFESLMSQLRHNTIACSFIPVSSQFSVGLRLGQVPYTHLLQFIATATLGAYLSNTPNLDNLHDVGLNVYHQGLLTWSFQKALGGQKADILSEHVWQELDEDLAWSSRSRTSRDTEMWLTPLMKKKHTDRMLHISLSHLISCRLREGYIIKEVQIKKGESQIEVTMVLPWRDNVWIYYKANSSWPFSQPNKHTHVDITVEASYDFLHDVTCPQKKPFKSPYRTALVKKYWQTLQVMSETELMLVHLQSFASNPTYYRVPDSVKNGVPLFYMPANSTNPQLSLQHSAKDTYLNQFATFWKAVLHLDGNAWQKWLHTQRLSIVLAHDVQLGKHLHTPNSSDRFHTITCRQSLTNLHFCLINWTTFVLLENHSYIKLLFDDADKPPISFFLLRLTLKPPCMVLRLAFLGGTPGHLRRQTIEELVEEINKLTFPQRGGLKDNVAVVHHSSPAGLEPRHVPPLQRQLSEKLCCIISQKPIEKILIRYERTPVDYLRDLPMMTEYSAYSKGGSANTTGSTVMSMLGHYLHHQRWVWSIQHGGSQSIPMMAVGRILSSLTKIRLQEGFMFAHAASGIINMVLEVDMKMSEIKGLEDIPECRPDPPKEGTTDRKPSGGEIKPCVIQYVVFPPYTSTNTRESVSEEDEEGTQDLAEADGELQIITELWVEPEHGTIINSTPERKHFDGLSHKQLPQAIYPTDYECISTMVTFEHLQLMCEDPAASLQASHDIHSQKAAWHYETVPASSNSPLVHTVPFNLDLMQLLPKCQQAELLFSTYIQDIYKLPMPSFNNTTLTGGADNARKLGRGPNETLFQLFLESMKDQHNLELFLSDYDCERLLGLIRERDRDVEKHPLPFVVEDNTIEGLEASCNHSESTVSVTTSVNSSGVNNVSSASKSTPLQTLRQRITSQWQRKLSAGSSTHRDRNNDSTSHDDFKYFLKQSDVENLPKMIPRWRCFVKRVYTNHIILCFIPASYNDLRVLVQGHAILRMAEIMKGLEEQERLGKDEVLEHVNVDGLDAAEVVHQYVDGIEHVLKIHSSGKHMEVSSQKAVTPKPSDVSVNKPIPENEPVDDFCNEPDERLGSGESETSLVTSTPKHSPLKVAISDCSGDIDEDSRHDTHCETLDDLTVHQDGCEYHEEPSTYRSFPIPVYVYSCPLTSLTEQIINKWTYCKPPDLFQDMNIIREEPPEMSRASSQEDVTEDYSADEFKGEVPHRRRQDSETLRERLFNIREELTSESSNNGDQDYFKQHCTLVSEYYLRSFVIGIFRSLLHNQEVSEKDIDAAINAICEESLPMETDLTKYLQNVCGHVRKVIRKAMLEQILREDLMKTLPKPDLTLSPGSQESGESNIGQASDDEYAELADQRHVSLKVPLAVLQSDSCCEALPSLHTIIKEKFTTILHQYFQPVQSNADYKGYFFYCPASFRRNRDISETEKSEGVDFEHGVELKGLTSGEDSDYFQSDAEGHEEVKHSEQESVMSIKDSGSISSLNPDDLDLEGMEDDEEDEEDIPPLFLNLSCSLRTSQGTLQSVPVNDIPTCFNELKSCMKDLPEEIDLEDMYVTLDMICLTLPLEAEEDMPTKRPCFNRLTSFTGQNDSDDCDSQDDRDESYSYVTSMEANYLKQTSGDVLDNLPKRQKQALEQCKNQIQWQLEDEIASSLRLMLPVSAHTLEMVANHVQNSVDRPNCIAEEVPLQFVYGPEKSLSNFTEDFERMDLPGYHLQKEGCYYFLSMNRVHVHAQALRCAIESLKEPQSPSDSKQPAKQSSQDMDVSVEVLPCKLEEMEAFHSDDIKISVIRPSPVKEMNAQMTEDDVAKRMAEDDDSSDSIQVLDDEGEDQNADLVALSKPEDLKLTLPLTMLADSKVQYPTQDENLKTSSQTEDGTDIKDSPQDKVKQSPRSECGKKNSAEKPSAQKEKWHKRRAQQLSGESCMKRSFESDYRPYPDLVARSQSAETGDSLAHTGQFSPLTIVGFENRSSSMRRVHSSASMEKYKSGQLTHTGITSQSGGTTPSRPLGMQTPTRSHHPSGLQTPLSCSVYYPSSRSSVGEEGYEGDSSDLDEDGAMMSFSERSNAQLLMPNFWLIMQIKQDKIKQDRVHVFFHARDTQEEETEESIQQRSLYNIVIQNIKDICKTVNQRLLLKDLFETRMCNSLLVCEADEDVRWAKDKYRSFHNRARKMEDSDDSDNDTPQDKYLHAALKLMPGHFACDKVWSTMFVLHPRLKTGHNRSGNTRGVQALKSVLNTFSVNNRKNLFVIKDTSENVFYLRMEEGDQAEIKGGDTTPAPSQREDEWPLAASRSSSLLSLPTKKTIMDTDDEITATYQSPRHFSIGERPGEDDSKQKESLTLAVYGITSVGAEITQDLVQLLQKKLDDVVLDILTVMLARNPMCKLMPEDIQFIQVTGRPKEVVRLTIPPVATLQQFALGYYLRQNLLQFLSTPKYADPRQVVVFRDYTQQGSPAIPDNVVFLYNRPHQAGGKGIACLQMQFVDGRGNPVQLISGPKPCIHAYKDPLDKNDFEKLVSTTLYHIKEGSKGPDEVTADDSTGDDLPDGPTALVQFNIWERGDVDVYQLTELLVKAMKQAACDVIMEYQLLTAPLCEVPMQPLLAVHTQSQTGPGSPRPDSASIQEGVKVASSHEPLKRQTSERLTPREKSATFNILTDVFKSKNRESPRESPASPVPSELEEMRKREGDVQQQRILKYEQGDKGTLNHVFTDTLPAWLDFAYSLDVPSIHKCQFTLVSRTAVDYVLKEFQSTVSKIVSDISPRVFRHIEGGAGFNSVYIPYSPTRAPMSAQDTKMESSMDFASQTPCILPGRECHFLSVGRNVNQWKASIDYCNVDEEMNAEVNSQNNPKTHKGHQRFPPYDPSLYTADRGEGGLSVPPTPTVANADLIAAGRLSPKESCTDHPLASEVFLTAGAKVFVPRQRFILMTVDDKEFCVYTYNWPSEHSSRLEKQCNRVIQWHNGREHLLSCILTQKMGLFQHTLFGDLPADPHTQEVNPFIQNPGDIDTLVRYTSPVVPPLLQQQQTRSRQPSSAMTPPVLFEDLYRDTKPTVPMHKASYGNLRDPLHKHGAQMMELRSRLRKEAEKVDKLSSLYMMWQQRMGSTPIGDDVLELLKVSSRLVHSVATPLLFSPQWRRRVVPRAAPPDPPPPLPAEPKQVRSRHSSGASMRSKRSDSMDSKIRIGVDSPEPSLRTVSYEEGWHMDLRHSFSNQYMQYLQSLLFVQINTRPPTPRRLNTRQRSGEKSSREENRMESVIHKDFMYLQKTFPGGIILLELGFKELYFCVNVYAFECSRLPVGKTVNPQLAVIFTEELDKFKDLTHVHSFAHDFHLRVVQTYIGNKQQMVFKHGYHLTNFLHDFITVFPYVPSFSRNFIFEASIQIDNTISPGSQLFEYMLNHDKQYGMRAIRMIPSADEDHDQEHEYALVMQFHCDGELRELEYQRARAQDYEVGLILNHQPSHRHSDLERNTLRLKFFIVLTSKMEMFPRDKLEKKLWAFKTGSLRRYTATGVLPTSALNTGLGQAGLSSMPVSLVEDLAGPAGPASQLAITEEDMGSWNESINYLGFTNKHQAIGYMLLLQLADIAKSKIQHMVENAMQQCRRDSLWRRMLLPPSNEDEGRRKRRSERQPENDDNFLTLLTFAEFEELMDIVGQERLERLDARLATLQNMSLPWFQGLMKVLINKYQDNHRLFTSNEARVQHLVVLNPNHLDAFMMLTIKNNKACLSAVYRENIPELYHTPDSPSLPALAMQNHIEGFVNACSYHMWTGLV